MSQPHLCKIFEAIGPYSAIAKGAMLEVQMALAAGWRVTVVAKLLDESLRDRVEWRKLYVPPRGFVLQWLTARHLIKQALGDPGRFDVIHGHQPQIADLCDVFQCHFLTRVAYERDCLFDQRGLRRAAEVAQKRLVLHAEDWFYSRWNPHTRMLFNSDLTRQEFGRLYGLPPREEVMVCPSPPWRPPSEAERRQARAKYFGDDPAALPADASRPLVVGYLGGLHERKGYRRLLAGLAGAPDITLLMGGQYCDGFTSPELGPRLKAVGLVSDVDTFYAACDVLAVPSFFEPLGLVAFEAASRGVPVIATPEVGASRHVLQAGAGVEWRPGETGPTGDLPTLVRDLVTRRDDYRAGCQRLTEQCSERSVEQRLLEVYAEVREEKQLAIAIAQERKEFSSTQCDGRSVHRSHA